MTQMAYTSSFLFFSVSKHPTDELNAIELLSTGGISSSNLVSCVARKPKFQINCLKPYVLAARLIKDPSEFKWKFWHKLESKVTAKEEQRGRSEACSCHATGCHRWQWRFSHSLRADIAHRPRKA
jgi:hypothetical protein